MDTTKNECEALREVQISVLGQTEKDVKRERQSKTYRAYYLRHHERNGYPKDFQILCYSCNMAKAFYGSCPHQNLKTPIDKFFSYETNQST